MYKVLIVDDEAIIRRGLKNIIDWKSLGCEVCGEASEGSKGAELIKYQKPEIIITDINMPGVDGLTMVKNTKEFLPNSKIIILTGYRDFEYTQEAIRLGAFDYVLKPSKIEVITNIVGKAVEELNKNQKRIEDMEKIKAEFEKKLPVLRQKLLYDIMFIPGYRVSDMEEELKVYGVNMDRYLVMALETDEENSDQSDSQYAKRLYQFGIINSFEDIIKEKFNVISVSVNNNLVVFIISINNDLKQDIYHILYEYALNLQELVRSCFNFSVTVALSSEGKGPMELSEKAKEAIDALEFKFYMGKNAIILAQDFKNIYKAKDLSILNENETQLIQSIKLGNEKSVAQILQGIEKKINEENISRDKVKKFYWNLISKIYNIPLELKIAEDEENTKKMIDTLQLLNQCRNVGELSTVLKDISNEISSNINYINRKTINQTLQRALDYIERNYKEQITLNNVAENTYVSTYYLSRMFTKELGKTFVDYLNEVRIERAKEYLKGSVYKTYEVAELVGIKDAHYFSKIFKKYTGTTPSEYKNK